MSERWGPQFAWTDERIATLTKLVAEGHSYSQIADVLGCSRNAACGKAHRLNIPQPANSRATATAQRPDVNWTPERDQAIRDGAMKGLTLAQIGAQLDCATGSVAYRAVKLGVSFTRGRRAMPKPVPAAAMQFGVGKNGVRPKPAIPWIDRIEPAGKKTLLELRACDCKFGIGDPNSDTFRFCGEPAVRGSYCASHASRCYVSPSPPTPKAGKELVRSLRRYA